MQKPWLAQVQINRQLSLGVTQTCLGVALYADQQDFDQYEHSIGQTYAGHISP